MNIENSAKELLKRYLRAVARYLPLNKRDDISREIESMVLDICEERYGDSDIDEQRMESILVETGKPSRLAAKYKETKLLIGPELMPIFKLVVFIICLVTSVISIINFALTIDTKTAGEMLLYFMELFSSLTSTVGIVFIVFVILERTIKNKTEIDFDDNSWRVKDLPELTEKIPSKAEIIAGLIFSLIVIIVLNLFIERIGIYSFNDKGYSFHPVLTDKLISLLPLFTLRIAVGAVVPLPLIWDLNMMSGEKKNYYNQISQMCLTVFDIGIIILFLSRGFNYFFMSEGFISAGLADIIPIADKIYIGILLLILVLSGISLIKRTLVILPKWRV